MRAAITVRISESEREGLLHLARQNDRSLSREIRRAVRLHLAASDVGAENRGEAEEEP